MRSNLLLASIVGGLMAMAVQPITAATVTPALTGSWQFTLTPSTPPVPPVAQIPGLATFTADGSVIETDGTEFVPMVSSTPLANPSTPGHGIWQPGPAVGTLYVQYISLALDTNGGLYARNVTTMILSLNNAGNQFSGTYTTAQATVSGTTRIVASGKVSGQLIPHPALP